jgi:hypothetical protein
LVIERETFSVVWWSEFLATDPEAPGLIPGHYIISGETASRPNKRLMRTYHCISLFMSYIKSAN